MARFMVVALAFLAAALLLSAPAVRGDALFDAQEKIRACVALLRTYSALHSAAAHASDASGTRSFADGSRERRVWHLFS